MAQAEDLDVYMHLDTILSPLSSLYCALNIDTGSTYLLNPNVCKCEDSVYRITYADWPDRGLCSIVFPQLQFAVLAKEKYKIFILHDQFVYGVLESNTNKWRIIHKPTKYPEKLYRYIDYIPGGKLLLIHDGYLCIYDLNTNSCTYIKNYKLFTHYSDDINNVFIGKIYHIAENRIKLLLVKHTYEKNSFNSFMVTYLNILINNGEYEAVIDSQATYESSTIQDKISGYLLAKSKYSDIFYLINIIKENPKDSEYKVKKLLIYEISKFGMDTVSNDFTLDDYIEYYRYLHKCAKEISEADAYAPSISARAYYKAIARLDVVDHTLYVAIAFPYRQLTILALSEQDIDDLVQMLKYRRYGELLARRLINYTDTNFKYILNDPAESLGIQGKDYPYTRDFHEVSAPVLFNYSKDYSLIPPQTYYLAKFQPIFTEFHDIMVFIDKKDNTLHTFFVRYSPLMKYTIGSMIQVQHGKLKLTRKVKNKITQFAKCAKGKLEQTRFREIPFRWAPITALNKQNFVCCTLPEDTYRLRVDRYSVVPLVSAFSNIPDRYLFLNSSITNRF